MIKVGRKTSYFGISEFILGLIITLLIIMLANRFLSSIRLDVTHNNIYTLSKGTKNILKGLSEPITLNFYYSKKLSIQLPGIGVYADRVNDTIREYQRIAGSNIKIKYIDPEPFSQAEDNAVANGLSGVPIDQSGNNFYFGLVATNSIDGREVIAFFSPDTEQQLEYDLSRLIQRLASRDENQVGIISTLPIQGDPQSTMPGMPSQPWFALEQLKQLHQLRFLDRELDSLDQGLEVLLVVQPFGLSKQTLFAIDQYTLNGGKVILFIDPFAESVQTPGELNTANDMTDDFDSPLSALLSAWGISMTPNSVVADLENALRVQSAASGRSEVLDYPVWFQLDQTNMNADDPAFQQLGEIVLASSGELSQTDNSTTEFTILLSTSTSASLLNTDTLQFQTDPKEVLKLYHRGDKSMVVGARISGVTKTAFPNYSPELLVNESNDEIAHLKTQPRASLKQIDTGDINVVVIADTDMLRDQFWVQVQNFLGSQIAIPSAGNGKLLANLVDQMSGSSDLISVRNKGSANRPFILLDTIRQNADQKFLQKEQELTSELADAENKLVQLEEAKNSTNSAILTEGQQRELEKFTNKKLQIRKELRQVRHSLQNDIERVQKIVKLINIVLIPVLIVIIGLLILFLKSRRAAS